MKFRFEFVALFALAGLAGCGAANDASSVKDATLIHQIKPWGVATSCFGSYDRRVTDHRFTPPRVYTQYLLGMKDCSPPASSLVIQMLGGQQWVGGYSYVTIKKNGLCLTNPVEYAPGGTDKGETLWQACAAQNTGSADSLRQQWLLTFNNNNALRIETHAAQSLGLPNAQVQCLDRQTPTDVKRVPCTNNNWQVVRAN
jgi:hypothetical protein